MNANELADTLNPRTAELYLSAHGWRATAETAKFSTWSRARDDQLTHLFLPLSPDPPDYQERLFDFVEKLARAEGRGTEVILTNLRYAAADLVRVRLEGPNVRAGDVPLDDGAGLFEGTRKLMLAAACAAIERRPQYGPRKPAAVSHYLENVRLGQTETGSYVVTVISELSTTRIDTLLPAEAPAPFERRVTSTLIQALNAAKQATQQVLAEEEGLSVFEDKVAEGVSANLCDAIALLRGEQDPLTMAVTVDWSAAWPPPTKEAGAELRFGPADMDVAERAAAYLRQLGPFENVEVEGFVSRLERSTGDRMGTIVIEGVARDERRNVYVELADEQYRQAIAAHESRARVSIRGTLLKEGRHWVLVGPSELTVIGEDG